MKAIVIHCAATRPGQDIDIAEVRRWHMDPKKPGGPWSDVGYHWFIRRSGHIEKGREEWDKGAHVKGFNVDTNLAYLFAHDTSAGGKAQCFGYAGTGAGGEAGPIVELGRNPRFVLIRCASTTGNWNVYDTTRTPGFTGDDSRIPTNGSSNAATTAEHLALTGTGFQVTTSDTDVNGAGKRFMGLAIF